MYAFLSGRRACRGSRDVLTSLSNAPHSTATYRRAAAHRVLRVHPPATATKSPIRQPPGMLHELGVPMSPARPCHGVPTTAARPSFPPQGSRHHLCLLATALASTPGHQNWANNGEKGLPPAGWCPPSPSQALCRLQHCYSLAMTSVITAEYILVVATGLMICI